MVICQVIRLTSDATSHWPQWAGARSILLEVFLKRANPHLVCTAPQGMTGFAVSVAAWSSRSGACASRRNQLVEPQGVVRRISVNELVFAG